MCTKKDLITCFRIVLQYGDHRTRCLVKRLVWSTNLLRNAIHLYMVLRTSQRASLGGHKPLNCSFASKTAERYYYCDAKNNSPPFTIKYCWCVGYHQMLSGKHNFVQVCNYGKMFHVLDASSTNSTLKHLEHWMSKFPS